MGLNTVEKFDTDFPNEKVDQPRISPSDTNRKD